MKRLGSAAIAAWVFIAGDDWLTAIGVVLALGLTALLADDRPAWIVMPVAVIGLLAFSIWRAARAAFAEERHFAPRGSRCRNRDG